MKFSKSIFLFFTITVFSFSVFAQNNQSVDLSFRASVSKAASIVSLGQKLQPDGKIIVYGRFSGGGENQQTKVLRLNTDGSIDASFNCTACSFFVGSVLVQPDGKIVIAGSETGFPRIIRINADGSLDDSFTSPFSGNPAITQAVVVYDIQADGKIYVTTNVSAPNFVGRTLYRLNPNGSIDNTFTPLMIDGQGSFLAGLKVLPDGRIFIWGNTPYGYLAQINPDGSKNPAVESPNLTYTDDPFTAPSIGDVAFTGDGKMVIYGRFNAVNGINRKYFARLNSNGSLDLQYTAQLPLDTACFGCVNAVIEILPGDKLLVGTNGLLGPKIVRLNADGSLDNSFTAPANFELGVLGNFIVDSMGRIYLFAEFSGGNPTVKKYVRLNADGSLDPSFNPIFEINGSVSELAIQTDGKIIIGGDFIKVDGIARKNIARLNADGSLDPSFVPGSGFDGLVNDIALQPDGRILVGGGFDTYNGTPRAALARLNSDGALDASFTPVIPNVENVNTIAVQPDGKILIGGTFQTVNSTARTALARLNSDGSLDTSFNPVLGGSPKVNFILLQSDGKIMVGGSFGGVNGFNRSNLARFNSDGSLDTSFTASINEVKSILRQPDGKYLILHSTRSLSRLNSNGSADNGFTAPSIIEGTLEDFFLQDGGAIIIGGNFRIIHKSVSKKNIVRLKPNGELDVSFLPNGANYAVRAFAAQTDGKILVGGDFTLIGDAARESLARLFNIPFVRRTNFDFDGDGRADIAVFRPSNGVWYQLLGANYQFAASQFGVSTDFIVPADYDGDGKTDIAVYRPSENYWYILNSSNNTFSARHWGESGDIPMPSDVDGDGKANLVVLSPGYTWNRLLEFAGSPFLFGAPGDKPLIGDFDGDGKSDPAVFRTSTGEWWYASSKNNFAHTRAYLWGVSTDIPVAADFDGDGITDAAVYRPSDGYWYIYHSSSGQYQFVKFGVSEDKPVAADYDGDGRADIAVYRPSDGTWYLLRSTEGFLGVRFGISTDIPIPFAFVP